jgi:hypothetical protein
MEKAQIPGRKESSIMTYRFGSFSVVDMTTHAGSEEQPFLIRHLPDAHYSYACHFYRDGSKKLGFFDLASGNFSETDKMAEVYRNGFRLIVGTDADIFDSQLDITSLWSDYMQRSKL